MRRYSFYDPSRVLVVDPVAPDADAIAAFVAWPVSRLDAEQCHLYSLASWVEEIIPGRRHHHHDVYTFTESVGLARSLAWTKATLRQARLI